MEKIGGEPFVESKRPKGERGPAGYLQNESGPRKRRVRNWD